ncbi:MAG: hypothetical protein WCI05_03340 [Myxococcales bacterium]|jgi:hypothetical protein
MAAARRFDLSHPHALAVYCSDGRFTDAVEELLHGLGHARLDTLTIPGGPALLDLTSSGTGALDTTRAAASFLVRGHGLRHVTLLAHEGCGYYRERYRLESPEAMLRRQLADLRGAARWITNTHPSIEVALYFARIEAGVVVFDAVTLAATR